MYTQAGFRSILDVKIRLLLLALKCASYMISVLEILHSCGLAHRFDGDGAHTEQSHVIPKRLMLLSL